jgi:hypothetical protein
MRLLHHPALFTVPAYGYAISLVVLGNSAPYFFTAAVVAVIAVVYSLPWRVPRDDRTPFGYWFEALVCAVPLAAGAVWWLAMDPHGARAAFPPTRPAIFWLPAWLVVAVAVGIVIVWWSGVNLRALRTGDLAFLAGPLPAHRAAARIWTVVVSVVSEEVIFRGVPAGIGSYQMPAMLVGAVAFVSGHHIVRGAQHRLQWRVVGNEMGAAVLLGGLVVLSGSVWPAVAAHAIADIPHVTLDLQRARADHAESDQVREVAVG